MGMRLRGGRGRPGPAWDDGAPDALVTELAALARSLDPAPSDPRVPATRASVLGAFAAAGAAPDSALRADRQPAHRPALALLLAGALLVAVSFGAAASTPGRPLYGLRLAVEELVLPEATGPRDVAQLDRLDERLREAATAAAARDEGALRASLGEYARIADSMAARVGPDSASLARVHRHLAVLDGLPTSGPLGETERVRARTAALALVRALGGPGDPTPSSPPPVPSSGPGAGGLSTPGMPGSSASPGPGDPGGPRASGGPDGSGGPSGSGDPGGPRATTGPRASVGPGGAGGPGPGATGDPGNGQPGPGSGSGGSGAGEPTPAPGGGSGSGSGPGDGSGSGGTGPAPSSDPGSGPGSGSGAPGDGGGSDRDDAAASQGERSTRG